MARQRASTVRVFKFGGTSVGSAEALRTAAAHVEADTSPVVVVVSAMAGITDLLLAAARAARDQDADRVSQIIREFSDLHLGLVRQTLVVPRSLEALSAEVAHSTSELVAMCDGVRILRELTPRAEDAVVARGERLLARLFVALLGERRRRATYVDATDLIFTERRFGRLWPDFARCEKAATRKVKPSLRAGSVVVLPGFLATGPEGELVTLGRGGSDFSAAIVARALHAGSLTLWKEVDGLMTADPRSVPDARVVPELHYREAAELAYYGAKVLHPRTMLPLVERGIPLHVRNTFNAAFSGTRIAGDVQPGAYPVKALTAIPGQSLVSVEGSGMIGVPGVAARTFGALAQAGHSVSMISQSSSESSICLVVPDGEAEHATRALREAFAPELATRLVDTVRAEKGISLVAVVGLGMRGVPGIAARSLSAVAGERINVVAMAQGSSELNITLAVRDADAARALQALHREYQLDRIRPLPDMEGRQAALALLGFGKIGRELSRQIAQQERFFAHELGLSLRCVAVADRSGVKVREQGFEATELEQLAQRKEGGRPLFARTSLSVPEVGQQLREKLYGLPSWRSVLVDLTADETASILREALEQRCHVVLANKKPLTGPQDEFAALVETARRRKVSLRYEATVGAGLPVLDTLKKLAEAGDRVDTILGCLSGTLGYVMTQLEGGARYSEAVRRAFDLGYTEPDPRDDLSGTDVARKALILARTLGRRGEMKDIALEPLFPPELGEGDPQRFLAGLAAMDEVLAERLAAARRAKEVLRYVARIENDGIRVGVEAVPEASPLGRLQGTDNQVVLHTRRYRTNPLVVTGPGAGAEVTAAGVLNDILAVATGGA
jgi:aspartokinase/homoserine dehydrogenase 1